MPQFRGRLLVRSLSTDFNVLKVLDVRKLMAYAEILRMKERSMRLHQVEVDDEVFRFVKGNAEPLVDNFNSTLRRLLPLGATKAQHRIPKPQTGVPKGDSALPSLPSGTPQALRQILEVVHLVRGGAYTRTAATQFVSKQHGITPQAVIDKYGRQLNLTASRFDRLLEQQDFADLQKLLKSKFPEYSDAIAEALR